jgi:hypothetical protein
MLGLIFQYGIILQALAIVHFIRRRPEGYWLLIILMGGAIGALAYIAFEVIPDAGLLRGSFQAFPRRKRIKDLQMAIIDNPSVGNFEELGDLYLDDKQYVQAREYLTKVIDKNPLTPDPYYRRALAAIAMDDYQSALVDLIQVYHRDDKYDYQRAAGLLALAMAKTGDRERAVALFEDVLQTSTLSEIQYNYASTLADLGRKDDARAWAERILAKKPSMPKYVRRQERPWFRKANALIKKVGTAA